MKGFFRTARTGNEVSEEQTESREKSIFGGTILLAGVGSRWKHDVHREREPVEQGDPAKAKSGDTR